MNNTYTLNIAGCKRELPLCEVSDHIDVAAFIMFGDVELTEKVAQELMKRCPEHDILLSAEAKGIPLVYEMARIGCRDYVVARKGIKTYMKDYIGVEVKSITTAQVQKLYLSGDRVEKLRGKRVLIIDDVISTGESLKALEELANKAGANVVGKAAVLAEGKAAERKDIIFLEKLPLFYK